MSDLTNCCTPPCSVVAPTVIPGPQGDPGTAGTNGVNAYSTVSAQFSVPGDTTTPVTITVSSTLWMVIGQVLIIGQGGGAALTFPGPATFVITSIPSPNSVTMLWLNASGDVAAGTAISSGAIVSPSGNSPAFLNKTSTLDFGSTPSQTSAALTISVPGASVGDPVALAIPDTLGGINGCFTAFVSAANVVTVQFNNFSVGAIDPGSGSFTVSVLHF